MHVFSRTKSGDVKYSKKRNIFELNLKTNNGKIIGPVKVQWATLLRAACILCKSVLHQFSIDRLKEMVFSEGMHFLKRL